jgi:hypothetical protein
MIALYYLLSLISHTCTRTIPFYICGVLLAPYLFYQITLASACFGAKGCVESAGIVLSQITDEQYGTVNASQSQDVFNTVRQEFPLLGLFIGYANFSGTDIQDLAPAMISKMYSFLNWYIFRRLMWIIVGVLIAMVIPLLTDKPSVEYCREERSRSSYEKVRTRSRRHRYE